MALAMREVRDHYRRLALAECLKAYNALGKAHMVKKKVSANATLPSAFYRTLGKTFTKCPVLEKLQNKKIPKK
jgi:hypothetical protein